MVRYRRNFVHGGTYFFTVTLADRRSSILVDCVSSLREAFRVTRSERRFTVDAIVVLPDLLHVVMTMPDGDSDFSGRWRRIKSLFARNAILRSNRMRKASTRYGNGDFGNTRSVKTAIARHIDYIHCNPIKHGYVTRAVDWPHSSFHRYVRLGVLPADWGGVAGESDSKQFGERRD